LVAKNRLFGQPHFKKVLPISKILLYLRKVLPTSKKHGLYIKGYVY